MEVTVPTGHVAISKAAVAGVGVPGLLSDGEPVVSLPLDFPP